jgi:hypothetical protein
MSKGQEVKEYQISDTVHFKSKYITQGTLTPEDTIVKALNDLTNALKQKRNKKGIVKYEALQKIDKMLNNIPATEHQVPLMIVSKLRGGGADVGVFWRYQILAQEEIFGSLRLLR